MPRFSTFIFLMFYFPIAVFAQQFETYKVRLKNKVNIGEVKVSYDSQSIDLLVLPKNFSIDEFSQFLNTQAPSFKKRLYPHRPEYDLSIVYEKLYCLGEQNDQERWSFRVSIWNNLELSRQRISSYQGSLVGKKAKLPLRLLKKVLESISPDQVIGLSLSDDLSKFANAKELPKDPISGIYTSFEEVISGEPSILLSQQELRESKVYENWYIKCDDCLDLKGLNLSQIWGIYDGNKFFYNLDGALIGLIPYKNTLIFNKDALKYVEDSFEKAALGALVPSFKTRLSPPKYGVAYSNMTMDKNAKEVYVLNLETGFFEKRSL